MEFEVGHRPLGEGFMTSGALTGQILQKDLGHFHDTFEIELRTQQSQTLLIQDASSGHGNLPGTQGARGR